MSEKWYSSGRGIFSRTGGLQIACMPIMVNWQEDTALIVRLLNAGGDCEQLRDQLAQVTKERDEARRDRDFFDNERMNVIAQAEDQESKLATVVEALEWYALTTGAPGAPARKALAAIRGKE